jgi:hypothetical protein
MLKPNGARVNEKLLTNSLLRTTLPNSARQGEGAGHTEEIAGDQERDRHQPSPVRSWKRSRHVHRTHLMTKQAIGNDK